MKADLKNTKENNAKVAALKAVKETHWVGEVTHNSIDKCLTAINLFQGANSGWYNPLAVRIKGVQGVFMVSEDGGLNFESRIIKIDDNKYKIEHLSNSGYNTFENEYFKILTIKKSKECSQVLQLMDQDFSYMQALGIVLKHRNVNREELETELNLYI